MKQEVQTNSGRYLDTFPVDIILTGMILVIFDGSLRLKLPRFVPQDSVASIDTEGK